MSTQMTDEQARESAKAYCILLLFALAEVAILSLSIFSIVESIRLGWSLFYIAADVAVVIFCNLLSWLSVTGTADDLIFIDPRYDVRKPLN